MKTWVQPGEVIEVTAPYTVTAGQGLQVGSLFGVALHDATIGATVSAQQCGVMDITKEPSLAISAGARVYWDDTNRRVTTTANGNLPIGICIVAALSAATTVRVLTMDNIAPVNGIIYRTLLIAVTAVANTDFTWALPAGHILEIYSRTTTAFGAATNANLTVGTTVGGGEIVASVDIKTKGNVRHTLVNAGSDLITPYAGGSLNVRLAQVGTASATGAATLIAAIAPTA